MQIWNTDEKIAAAARRAEVGVPVSEIVRKLEISEAVWKKDFVRIETLDIEDLIQLSDDMCDENAHDSKRLDPPAQTRYSDEEIAAAVRQAESGVPVAEIVRKLRVSEATFSVWVKRFEGFQTSEICELRGENAQLRRLAADLARKRKVCKTCAGKVERNTTTDSPRLRPVGSRRSPKALTSRVIVYELLSLARSKKRES